MKFLTIAICVFLGAFISGSLYGQGSLDVGLVAHYSFTGNANDATVNANHGTPNGPTLRSDRGNTPNASYEFDGVNDNIEVPHSSTLDPVGGFHSVSFWFQLCFIPPVGDTKEYYLISKMDGSAINGWHVFMRRDGAVLRIYYRGTRGSFADQNIKTADISAVEPGSWHHITFMMGSNGGQFMSTMYDNANVDFGFVESPVMNPSSVPLVIGGGTNVWNAPTDAYFGLGRLDDIRIYNRALSESEVDLLYKKIPLTSFNQPVTLTENNALCLDIDSLVVEATSVPGMTYSWTGPGGVTYSGSKVVIYNPSAAHAGTYTLTPSFEGCPRPTRTITVAPPLPRLALTGPAKICTNAPFTYSVPNNTGAVYTWNYPGTTSGTSSGNTFSSSSAVLTDAGDYWVRYQQNGCVGYSDTVSLEVVSEYQTTAYDTICQGQSIFLGGANQTVAGSYQDLYQSITGCDSLVTTELFVKPLPQVSLGGNQQSCVGSSVTLTPTTNGTIVVWSNGQTTPSITVTTDGNYWVEAVLDGCTNRDVATVSFFLTPAANFLVNNAGQCLSGNSFSFTPQNNFAAGTTFAWSFSGSGTPTSTLNNPSGISWDAPGTYAVTLSVTENGCVSAPASSNIVVYPQPIADFTAFPLQGCEPVEVKFNNTTQSSVTYTSSWTLGGGMVSPEQSPVHTYMAGTYSITLNVVDANGCTATQTRPNYVTVFPQPVAGFTILERELTTTNPILTVSNTSLQSSSCMYVLNDGSSYSDCNFTANIVGTGTYTITQIVTSGLGCLDSTSQTFNIRPKSEIFIPNAFSPNGDHFNERFEPSLSYISDFDMTIYDRWGAMVFRTDDLFTYWNGKVFNLGSDVPQGVYVYKIRYQPFDQGKNVYLSGHVTLFR